MNTAHRPRSEGLSTSLEGRLAIVTGANGGLGLATTRELLRRGARVIMACRDQARGKAARASLGDSVPLDLAEVRALDLASLRSIESFASPIERSSTRVDLLFNNAGIMAVPWSCTDDGFESQWGINHLGHFALTARLQNALLRAEAARVVTTTSLLHLGGRIEWEDPNLRDRYRPWRAYRQSKLANLLFARELERWFRARGPTCRAQSFAAHPGYADTSLTAVGPQREGAAVRAAFFRLAGQLFAQSPEHGAAPQIYAATAPQLVGGQTFGPAVLQIWGPPRAVATVVRERDIAAQARLWSLSAKMTGVSFDP